MSRCPTCGASFNKGKRRHVLLGNGDLVQRVVCGTCATTRAISIVPVQGKTACTTCKPGEQLDATTCSRCVNDSVHKAVRVALGPFVRRLRDLAKTYRLDSNPLHEGLEMAADILEEGRN
jgi:hypothetical protein